MPHQSLSPNFLMLLNTEQNVCLGKQTITRAIFRKDAVKENPPPYIQSIEFMPKMRNGELETALSFIHQEDGVSNDDIKHLAKTKINPNGSVWYLAQLLIQKIADMRYENGTKINLTIKRDNIPFDKHTSMYPVSEDVLIQQEVAAALASVAGKPIVMKGTKKFD